MANILYLFEIYKNMHVLSALFNVQIGTCIHALHVYQNAQMPKALTTSAVRTKLLTPINTSCTLGPTSVHSQLFGPSRRKQIGCFQGENIAK